MEKFWQWLQKFWAIPLFIIGAITEVFQFVELWRGARDTFTWVAIAVGLLLVIGTVSYISFSKVESPIVRAHSSRKLLPRFPNFFMYARSSLMGFLILAVFAGFMLHRQDLGLRNKLVVLVTTFDGPDPQKYRVTDIVVRQLNNVVNKYDDTVVRSINKSITENDGSKLAKELGKQYRADLVIWGWYGATDTDVILTVHVESLGTSIPIQFPNTSYILKNKVEEFKSFRFQQKLSDQMTSLTLFTGGILRYEVGDYEGALSRLILAKDSYIWPEGISGKESLYSYLGQSYRSLNQQKNASDAFTLAISANPSNPKNYIDRCYALINLSKHVDALQDCNKAIEIKPLVEGAYTARASLFVDLNEIEKAWSDVNYEVDAFPNNHLSYSARAYVLISEGKFKEALSDAQKAVTLAPNEPSVYHDLAQIYSELGNGVECLTAANEALRVSSTSRDQAVAYGVRSDCYTRMRDSTMALTNINTSIDLDPGLAMYYFIRGQLYSLNNEFEKAISDYSKGIGIDSGRPDAFINRGKLYAEYGFLKKAESDFQTAVQISPGVVRGWFNLGLIYDRQGRYSNAVLAYTEALKQNAFANTYNGGVEYARIYLLRGLALKELGNPGLAIKDFNSALASPDVTSELKVEIEKQLSLLNEVP